MTEGVLWSAWSYGNYGSKKRIWFVYRTSFHGRGQEQASDKRGRTRMFERRVAAQALMNRLNNAPPCAYPNIERELAQEKIQ